jgi:hypothetical protein
MLPEAKFPNNTSIPLLGYNFLFVRSRDEAVFQSSLASTPGIDRAPTNP